MLCCVYMNTRIAMVAALLGVFTASSAQAQFGGSYFDYSSPWASRGPNLSGLKSTHDLERSRILYEAAKARNAQNAQIRAAEEGLRLAQEQNRILEHSNAAFKILGDVTPGDRPRLKAAVSKIKSQYPAANYDKAFQALMLFHLESVEEPQKYVSNLVAYFEKLNAESAQKASEQQKRDEAVRVEQVQAEIQGIRRRTEAAEQRALDLEERLRYDQFERDEQNRILNSRINNANQRLRDAEWEAAKRSRFPFIQSQP